MECVVPGRQQHLNTRKAPAHEAVTRSQQDGESNLKVTANAQTDRHFTLITSGTYKTKRRWCSTGVCREKQSSSSPHIQATSSVTHHGPSTPPLIPLYFLSLCCPLSLPSSYSSPLAKSFPRFPFLFGLLMWCLECRGEKGREGARVCRREDSHAHVSLLPSIFLVNGNQKIMWYVITIFMTLASCKNTVLYVIRQRNSIVRTNNKTNEARGDLLRQTSPLRRLPSLGNSFCEWNGNTAGIWDDWNPHGARAARLIPVPVVLSLSALRDVIGAIGSVGRGKLKGRLRLWWATSFWLRWNLGMQNGAFSRVVCGGGDYICQDDDGSSDNQLVYNISAFTNCKMVTADRL